MTGLLYLLYSISQAINIDYKNFTCNFTVSLNLQGGRGFLRFKDGHCIF